MMRRTRGSTRSMKRTPRPYRRPAAWLLCTCAWAGLLRPAFGAGPETRPLVPARIEPAKDETPRQALERGCKVVNQLDANRAMELFRYDVKDPKERDMTQSLCAYAVAATRVEQAVRRKFGDDAAAEMVHAIGETTEKDLADADVTVDGDTATVKLPHSSEPVKMVREDGVWKVSVKDLLAGMSDEDAKATMEKNKQCEEGFDRVAGKVEAGKLKTAEAVNEAVDRVINPPPPQPGGPV